jgi:Pyruvate/2-oxoacid:ferredoxin oxidoreductase gamma subunit
MMGHKPYTYAVLAIALGYLLISVVPSRLTPMHYQTLETERPGETVTAEGGTLQEDEASITTEEEELGEEVSATATSADAAKAAADAAKAAADEARTAASGLTTVGGFFGVFGNLLISLAVAFGVYWIAKQRFT